MGLTLDTAHRSESGALFISWSGAPATTEYFNVEINYGQPGEHGWVLISTTTNSFVSDFMSRKTERFFDERYYRVSAVSSSGEVLDTLLLPDNVKNVRPIVDRTKNLLNYAAEVVLTNSSWAYKAFIIKPRRMGKTCVCHNTELRSSVDPSCSICYGTGYTGGFYDPLPVRAKIHSEQVRMSQANAPIPVQSDVVQFVIPTIIKVFPKDYLYIPSLGYRFICLNTNVDSLVTAKTATQMTTFSRLDQKDTFYKYPIDTTGVSVESVKFTGDTVTVEGAYLYPVFGSVKVVFGKKVSNSLDGIVLTQFDLESVTNKKLTFKQHSDTPLDFLTDLSSYEYRVLVNGERFDGTATPA